VVRRPRRARGAARRSRRLAVELLANRDGLLVPVEPARTEVLGCTVERVADDHLRVTPDGPDSEPVDIRL